MAKNTNQHTNREDRFRELSDIEHVRLRLPIYLGSKVEETFTGPIFGGAKFEVGAVTFIPALLKAVSEVIDNSVDELTSKKQKTKTLAITVDPTTQTITVADNGGGIPLDKRPNGKYRPEVALASLRAGSNFDDTQHQAGVIGQNGVGASCTNICSSRFTVDVWRDGKHYRQVFLDGTREIKPPKITSYSGTKTGTEITFVLDPKVFGHTELPMQALRNRAYEIALTNPTFTVTFNGEKIRYKKGLPELAAEITRDHFVFFEEYEDGQSIEFVVIPEHSTLKTELVLTWVNSSLLYGGGMCNTQFVNAFCDKVMEHLATRAKRAKIEMHKDDVRQGLLILGNLKLKGPTYDSQAKTRLTGPSVRRDIDALIDAQWASFVRKNKEWIEHVFANAEARYHARRNKEAVDNHKRSGKKAEGLVEATERDRSKCVLFITEGESAKGAIQHVREPHHAAIDMTGKINNVYDATPAQVLAMPKVAGLLSTIGLTPGHRVDPYSLRYGMIVIATDADTDGAHIATLLANLFYKFWPELFDPARPRIYRLMTPNVVAYNAKERIHFSTKAEFDKVSSSYMSYNIKYMKGLGSMTFDDWRQVLANLENNCYTLVDDGNLASTFALHFGDDALARKQWLMNE